MSIRKTFLTLLAAPLLLVQGFAYSGQCCPQTYCDECCCADWSIYADWLYWRARRCDLDYAAPLHANNNGDSSFGSFSSVEPSYESGVRVGLMRECGCLFFDAFYTYYSACESDHVSDPSGNLAGTRVIQNGTSGVSQGSITEAHARWELDYNTVDILAGYELCSSGCWQSFVFGGLKLAFIDQELKSFYCEPAILPEGNEVFSENALGPANKVRQEIDMNAYGVNLGIGGRYNICQCLDFFGRFSYDVLLGDFKRKVKYESSPNGSSVFTQNIGVDDDCWRMISVINLSFGLGYNYLFSNCCCANLGVAVGYEFHHWLGMPDFLTILEFEDYLITRPLQTFGLDGLFVRVSLGF